VQIQELRTLKEAEEEQAQAAKAAAHEKERRKSVSAGGARGATPGRTATGKLQLNWCVWPCVLFLVLG